MDSASVESSHAVEILAVKDEAAKATVARAVAEASKSLTFEQTRARIESLPWTLTQGVPTETATYLVKLLEGAGAVVRVDPALGVPPRLVLSPDRIATSAASVLPGSMPQAAQTWSRGGLSSRTSVGCRIEPLSLIGILTQTVHICMQSFWKLTGIVVIVLLMSFVLTMVLEPALYAPKSPAFLMAAPRLGVLVLVIIASGLIGCGFAGAMYYAVSSVYLNRAFGIFSSYRSALGRVPALVYTSLLFFLTIVSLLLGPTFFGIVCVETLRRGIGLGWWQGLVYLFLWISLAVIALYAMSKLLMFDRVVILEDTRGIEALKRSWCLMGGKAKGSWPARHWMRYTVLLLVLGLAWIAIRLLLMVPVKIMEPLYPESLAAVGTVVSYGILSIGDAVAILFWSVCGTVFYFDLRNRKEAFDSNALAAASVMRRSE